MYRGPVTKATLAFYLDRGLLRPKTQIVHMSQVRRRVIGQQLSFCVQEWKADSIEYQGEHKLMVQAHASISSLKHICACPNVALQCMMMISLSIIDTSMTFVTYRRQCAA